MKKTYESIQIFMFIIIIFIDKLKSKIINFMIVYTFYLYQINFKNNKNKFYDEYIIYYK